MNKYQRAQKVSQQQREQKLHNAVKLIAYIHGLYDGGYPVLADGHIDGFKNNYVFIHDNPGNIECHPVTALYVTTDCLDAENERYVKEILDAVENAGNERPGVVLLTDEIEATCKAEFNELLPVFVSANDAKGVEAWLDTWVNNDSLDAGTLWDTSRLAEILTQ